MHVYIDDSGDPALKMAIGSTRYLVIACALFESHQEVEVTSLAIEKYRAVLGFNNKHEFKFSKSKPEIRKGFLHEISQFNFILRAIVIDKTAIYSDYFQQNNKSLYNYAIKEVLSKSSHLLKNARVKIDGNGNREMKKFFQNYIKSQINNSDGKLISKIKFLDSKNDNLIQLADMLAGAVRRSFEGDDALIYKASLYEIVSRENSDIWVFK